MIDGLTYEEAKQKEIEFIKLYKRIKDGGTLVNLTDGGDGAVGMVVGDETRRKISAIHKGKISPLKGTKLSEEHRKRLSAAGKGRPSHRKGKKLPPHTVQKMIEGLKRMGHPMHGKFHSEETKRKVGDANTGHTPVLCFKDGILIQEYVNLVAASMITGFKRGSIGAVLTGYNKMHKGYVWKYKDQDVTYKRKKR